MNNNFWLTKPRIIFPKLKKVLLQDLLKTHYKPPILKIKEEKYQDNPWKLFISYVNLININFFILVMNNPNKVNH